MYAYETMPLNSNEDDMPVVELIIALKASSDRIEEMRDVLQALREAAIQDPGCLDYRIARGSLSENRFFLLERRSVMRCLFSPRWPPRCTRRVIAFSAGSKMALPADS